MKNFIQDGDRITITAFPEAADSGEFIMVGDIYGVSEAAIESGAEGVLVRKGVYELPKATGAAWTQGQKLYWDVSAKKFTADATKVPVRAAAAAAAGSDDTTGYVLLDVGSSLKLVAGQLTTVTATDTVVTGLSKVIGAVASYDTDPADANTYVNATVGDQDGAPATGSIIVKTWKQSGSDPTPIAADAFSKKVNWLAWGY